MSLNGRATDSQFAQNPKPVVEAMAVALAAFHARTPSPELASKTPLEIVAVQSRLDAGGTPPAPFARVSTHALADALANQPEGLGSVWTHGAPVVGLMVLEDGVAHFEPSGDDGLDPPERDLTIALRSVAETFSSEPAAWLAESYEKHSGNTLSARGLDWYAILAAFR